MLVHFRVFAICRRRAGPLVALILAACGEIISLGAEPVETIENKRNECGLPPHPSADCKVCIDADCCEASRGCADDPACVAASECALNCAFDTACAASCSPEGQNKKWDDFVRCSFRCIEHCRPFGACETLVWSGCCHLVDEDVLRGACKAVVNKNDIDGCESMLRNPTVIASCPNLMP